MLVLSLQVTFTKVMIQHNIFTLTQIWPLDTFSSTVEKFNIVWEKEHNKYRMWYNKIQCSSNDR